MKPGDYVISPVTGQVYHLVWQHTRSGRWYGRLATSRGWLVPPNSLLLPEFSCPN